SKFHTWNISRRPGELNKPCKHFCHRETNPGIIRLLIHPFINEFFGSSYAMCERPWIEEWLRAGITAIEKVALYPHNGLQKIQRTGRLMDFHNNAATIHQANTTHCTYT